MESLNDHVWPFDLVILYMIVDRLINMEFSDTYKYTGPCAFSHDAQLLAVAADYRLVIRDVESLKVCFVLHLSIYFVFLCTDILYD
jgi:hypothetical protein